jgi:hypothetical protein
MRRRVLLCLTLIAMSACNGDKVVEPSVSPTAPTKDISDGANGLGSNKDFFFLPPMVKNPSSHPDWNAGAFNAGLRPRVEICTSATRTGLDNALSCVTVASLAASVNVAEEQYQANWQVPSSDATYYRLTVKVGSTTLGFADIAAAANTAQAKSLATEEIIPLVDGRTLPIKFRIERYALCETPGAGPCTSASGDISQGPLTVQTDESAPLGIVIPQQPGPSITVTIEACADFHNAVINGRDAVLDLPTFGPCTRVKIEPALSTPLSIPALVFSCTVNEDAVVAGGMDGEQAERITLHELNEQGTTPVVRALPQANPSCPNISASAGPSLKGMLAALAHGQPGSAARQLASLFAPKPLYAAARFIDLGGGGFTIFGDEGAAGSRSSTSGARLNVSAVPASVATVRDFQFALPAKFDFSYTPKELTGSPSGVLDVTVRVTDLGGDPVRNARVRFQASEGGSVDPAVVENTSLNGLAAVEWKLSAASTTNTLVASGRGIADDRANGPREGIDPFQPISRHWDGDLAVTGPAVLVKTGSITVTAVTDVQIVLNLTSVEKLPNGTQRFFVAAGSAGPYVWSVHGTDGGSSGFGLITTNTDFSADYTAPAAVPDPATFQVCARRQANPGNKACAAVTIKPIPSAGGEVFVINDLNVFDDGNGGANPENATFWANLVNFTGSGPRAARTGVWLYGGKSPYCSTYCSPTGNYSKFVAKLTSLGYQVDYVYGNIPITAVDPKYKVVILETPTLAFSTAEIAALKQFAAEGGRLIYMGEYEGYFQQKDFDIENGFLAAMGAVLRNTKGNYACTSSSSGWVPVPQQYIFPHQITQGLTSITFACASSIALGPNDYALFRDPTGAVIIGAVAKVDLTTATFTKLVATAPLRSVTSTTDSPVEGVLTGIDPTRAPPGWSP